MSTVDRLLVIKHMTGLACAYKSTYAHICRHCNCFLLLLIGEAVKAQHPTGESETKGAKQHFQLVTGASRLPTVRSRLRSILHIYHETWSSPRAFPELLHGNSFSETTSQNPK